MVTDDLTQAELSELSRHYDSTFWTVTSLWSAAIGGLLVYCIDKFNVWLALLGLGLTVCAAFFAASFRNVRRRVHERMTERTRELHVSKGPFRQWNMFLILFLVLAISWTVLLVSRCPEAAIPEITFGLVAFGAICWLWGGADATSGRKSPGNGDPGAA